MRSGNIGLILYLRNKLTTSTTLVPKFEWEIPFNELQIEEPLEESKKIFKGKWKDKEIVAIKYFGKGELEPQLTKFCQEVSLLKYVHTSLFIYN